MRVQVGQNPVVLSPEQIIRYSVLPWGNVLLQRKRLEVSKYASFAAKVLAVRKVTIVP